MLASKVEDMLNTVVRQIAFYSFERSVHIERRNGELTADANLRFLDERTGRKPRARDRADQDYKSYWAYIPHFIHSPFYVYAYAFGDCLVNSLYGVYQNAREGFAERYFAMLCGGRHETSLRIARAIWARRPRSRLLADRPEHDRRNDRRSRRFGIESVTRACNLFVALPFIR